LFMPTPPVVSAPLQAIDVPLLQVIADVKHFLPCAGAQGGRV
jgi:hypothetical protein